MIRNEKKAYHLYLTHGIILFLCWLFIEWIINPLGNYPLNDDWVYFLSIKKYVKEGVFVIDNWMATSFLVQFLYGVFFVKLFGLSFTVLKYSTLSLTGLLLFFTYHTYRQFGKPIMALLLTFVLLFNPLLLNLSNTFMPDIPVLAYSLIAIAFLVKYLQTYKIPYLVGFTILSILSVLVRQSAIILPISVAITITLTKHKKELDTFFTIWFPTICSFIVLSIWNNTMTYRGWSSGNYNMQLHAIFYALIDNPFSLASRILYYFITASVSIGLLLLPAAPLMFRKNFKQFLKKRLILGALIFYILLVILKLFFTKSFPFAGNMFYINGMGPIIMTGYDSSLIVNESFVNKLIAIILTFLGTFSFCIIVLGLIHNLKTSRITQKRITLFVIILSILYFLPIASNYFNDRYLIFLLPFLLLGAINWGDVNIRMIRLSIVLLIALASFSLPLTHDYFAVHNARWKALDYLVEQQKIAVTKIDGGFEFNALHHTSLNNYDPNHKGRWWFIEEDDYIISPFPRKGYKPIKTYPINGYIGLTPTEILILKKNSN